MTRHLTGLCIFLLASLTQAADLQGVGMFQTLDKPWFLVALYTAQPGADEQQAQAEKLELKVVEDKISVRRYRQLWKEVFAVAQDRDVWQTYAGDLNNFFELIKGPLKANDQLVIEATTDATVVSINYREHARLSPGFLPLVVATLTARIAPIPELRDGLLGTLPEDRSRTLLRQMDKGEPTLGRISETARWLRHSRQFTDDARISQL